MSGFTNLPWRWDKDHRCVVDSTNTVVAVSVTAQPHGYLPPDDPSYFHGRAFAAAPRMYEALKTIFDCYSICRTPGQFVAQLVENGFMEDARAVLTEIEGK